MKRIPKTIFELNKIVDNPLFEGFGIDVQDTPSQHGRRHLGDDMTPGFGRSVENPKWEQIQLEHKWKAPQAKGRVGPYNDFPCINLCYPAFSQRACDALKGLLEPNGELLPIQTNSGVQYYFYNITTVVDALDVAKSDIFWLEPEITAGEIEFFAFRREKLADLSIFRIHQDPIQTLVTDEFVRRVCDAGLNGFDFKKVWPFPRGVLWREQAKQAASTKKPAKRLKCHSLVVALPLKATKPTVEEKRAIKQLEDELDAQLTVSSLDAPFFGWYEGSEKVSGEFRMFLSCPDVDRLVVKLQPWLSCMAWPVTIHVMKRYGDMHDPDAKETLIHFEK